MAKASDNVFPRVIAGLNTTDQAAPSDSSWRIYAKPGGIYARSSNAVVGPFAAAGSGTATFNGCKAYHSTTQSIGSGSWTSINLDSEEFDTSSYHSTVSNTSRMTVPSTAYYMVTGGATFASNATGDRYLRIYKNGTTELRAVQNAKSTASGASDMRQVTGVFLLTAADYIEMQAFQDSGGNLNIGTGTTYFQTQLSITLLGT